MKKTVIVFEHIDESGITLLRQDDQIDLIYYDHKTVSDKALASDLTRARALLVRTAQVTRAMIQAAPHLEIISKHGVGYDNIDVAAATERKIPVTFAPGGNSNSVAEHVLAMLMTLTKKLIAADSDLKTNCFGKKEQYSGEELGGKTIGIIGLGRIGSRLARKAALGFGMTVLTYDPYIRDEYAARFDARRVGALEELLPASDYISLNVPLTPVTANMIAEKQLRQMKKSAILINTARGGIVNETDLYGALKEGRIKAAGLDVFALEPPTPENNPLLSLANVLVTPHVAGNSKEAGVKTATMAAKEIVDVLKGRPPGNPVNAEIYT